MIYANVLLCIIITHFKMWDNVSRAVKSVPTAGDRINERRPHCPAPMALLSNYGLMPTASFMESTQLLLGLLPLFLPPSILPSIIAFSTEPDLLATLPK